MSDRKQILITGASGFVGTALCRRLAERGFLVKGAVRNPFQPQDIHPDARFVAVGTMDQNTDWSQTLKGINAVIHLAARSHILQETSADLLAEYRAINVLGTKQLALQAAQAGVSRFVYLSSVKVNGEGREIPYTENDVPRPEDPYGISKWEAEQVLKQVSAKTGMETVIIRPPLVYGPGVKANFLRLMEVISRGIPLPFASVKNRRSIISLENLVDATLLCLNHRDARGHTFLVSDGRDLSTPELMGLIGHSLERPARLLPFPPAAMRAVAAVLGKGETIKRLLGSLTVDTSSIRAVLGWSPPVTTEDAMLYTSRWFKGRVPDMRRKSNEKDF